MRSFPLGAAVRFRGSFRERDFLSRNVVAVLPGSDPRLSQTSVLVLAHYDHLGIGPPVGDDATYNGVVDNALGVAGLLELARLIAALPERPRRTLVFLATTAEEKGLLGASYYVDHPAFPLHKTVAAVNVDGLAHFDTFRSVVGVGAALSSLGDVLERVASERHLGLEDVPTSTALTDPYAFSDQAALAQAGVPAILIHEGLDWNHHTRKQALERAVRWGRSIYHTPFDDVSQPLDFDAARQHVELLLAFILDVANDARPPRWQPGSPYALAQLRLQAEGR
jgi:Zn-dependent M28 family amino/carboxypeptidase